LPIKSTSSSLTALVRLHFAPKDFVHVGLVFPAPRPEPVEHVGVHAEAHQLLDWPVEPADLNVGEARLPFRGI